MGTTDGTARTVPPAAGDAVERPVGAGAAGADSPFTTGRTLHPSLAAAAEALDRQALGKTVTGLLRHAAQLPPAQREGAAAAIADLLRLPSGTSRPVDLQVDDLVDLYRELLSDPAHRPLARLIVALLCRIDRPVLLGSLGTDAASLRVRAALITDLDRAAATAADAAPSVLARSPGPTRGLPSRPTAATTGSVAGRGAGTRPRTYRAYGRFQCDEIVLVGRLFELDLGLGSAPQNGVAGGPFFVPLPEDSRPYSMDVQLFADGFDLAPGELWRQTLRIAADSLYPAVTVHLIARPIPDARADRSITATFAIEGEVLGTAIRHVVVTTDEADLPADGPASTVSGANVAAPTGMPPADLTITIKKGEERGVFAWGIESPLPGVALPPRRPPTTDIGSDPVSFMKTIIASVFMESRQPGLFHLLQGIGLTIHDAIPLEVRTAIETASAAVAPRPADILLLTEEPYVPWELAWVDHPSDAAAPQFLGAQANVGRWVLDHDTRADPPRVVDAQRIAVIWGVYTSPSLPRLVAAEQEAAQMQARYDAVPIDARPLAVNDLLDGNPPAEILHFAVHGRYAPGGTSQGIYLVEGPPIDDMTVRGCDLRARAPFVFLNACQVGAADDLLGSYAGIAQAFLRVGASAVVAPLWSVDDDVARRIALEFYAHALQTAPESSDESPRTVAALLRNIRKSLIPNVAEGSATYLAYQFYGHPSLRIRWMPPMTHAGLAGGESHD